MGINKQLLLALCMLLSVLCFALAYAYFALENQQMISVEPKHSLSIIDTTKKNQVTQTTSDTTFFVRKDSAAINDIAKKTNAKKDSTKKTILLTGDSMGDGLYMRLLKLKKYNPFTIIYRPWYGSNITGWGQSQRLADLIATHKPDFLIFTLGTNELFTYVNAKKIKNTKELLNQIGEIPYVWVGPPNWKQDWGLDSMLQTQVSHNYFVSKNMKFERRKDGAHPTFGASVIWMDSIARWVNSQEHYEFYFNIEKEENYVKNKQANTKFVP